MWRQHHLLVLSDQANHWVHFCQSMWRGFCLSHTKMEGPLFLPCRNYLIHHKSAYCIFCSYQAQICQLEPLDLNTVNFLLFTLKLIRWNHYLKRIQETVDAYKAQRCWHFHICYSRLSLHFHRYSIQHKYFFEKHNRSIIRDGHCSMK